MELNTAAAVIRFATEAEEQSAKFYDDRAKKIKRLRRLFYLLLGKIKKTWRW